MIKKQVSNDYYRGNLLTISSNKKNTEFSENRRATKLTQQNGNNCRIKIK